MASRDGARLPPNHDDEGRTRAGTPRTLVTGNHRSLGVEVFFVISGYLITLLLAREWRRSGTIDLRHFWLRRARRLLPALAAVLALTLAYALAFLPAEVDGLRKDAASAAGYVTNWWLIFGDKPYFETMGRPSLFQHLWSLAVEEQLGAALYASLVASAIAR